MTGGPPSADASSDETRVGELYDWWSRHPRVLESMYDLVLLGRAASLRDRSLETLDVTPGECVLEVGCGYGNSFPALREGVGSNGRLVGLDVSRGMVRSARKRVGERGWRNVEVVRGDARRPPLAPGAFDAAYAAMSLSAVPDPASAIEATRTALGPGGRLVVLDARPFQQWPWRLLNRLVVPISEYATDWVPEVDLVAVLRGEFETVEVSTFNAGSIVVACAHTADTGADSNAEIEATTEANVEADSESDTEADTLG